MKPTEAPIELVRGNHYSAEFEFLQSDGVTPQDLTGATIVWRATNGGTQVLRMDTTAGITVPTPSNGKAVLSLTPTNTRALPQGAVALYELELRQGGKEITVFHGKINATLGNNDDV